MAASGPLDSPKSRPARRDPQGQDGSAEGAPATQGLRGSLQGHRHRQEARTQEHEEPLRGRRPRPRLRDYENEIRKNFLHRY